MRVAIDARAIGSEFPGIGRATRGLLYGLHALDHDVAFIVFHQPQHRELLDAIGLGQDDRFRLHAWVDTPLSIAQQWNGPRLARRFNPDVWHAPYYLRPFFGLPPTVVTVFDTIGRAPASGGGSVRNSPRTMAWHAAMCLSIRTARHIVTASDDARRDLERSYHVSSERLSVVPLATEPHFQPPHPDAIAHIRTTYDLPERYVLYLGSNKPHKNLVALVEAWALIVRDALDGVPLLVLAGRDDPRYTEARQRTTQHGLGARIRFLPDVPDDALPALLGGATVFVFPSLHEGFGFPPLEAMAVGVPVVSSNRTSLPEVVGDAGWLVDPEPEALAAGVRRVLGDEALRSTLRRRGIERAAQFSWERTASMMLGLYRTVVQDASRSGSILRP